MIVFVSLLACQSKVESDSSIQDTEEMEDSAEDTANVDSGIEETDDTGEMEDSASDTGITEDTAEDPIEDPIEDPLENCGIALQINIDGTNIDSGGSVAFPSRPARTNPTDIELIMTNNCDVDLRFLGFPDDWMEGTGFSLATLPPILIPPQEEASMALRFTPQDEGTYQGTFTLPYDLPGTPFVLDVSAQASAPLRLVLVGDGVSAVTDDYGQTIHETQFTTEVHSNEARRGVCWGLGQFVAVGGSNQRNLWTSPDGLTWTQINQGSGWVADCAFGNNMLLAAGGFHNLSSSEDGITWSMDGNYSGEHLRSVAYGNGVFVAVGGSGACMTSTGETWDVETTHGAETINRIAYGNGSFVGAGSAGAIVISSDNGQTWSQTTVGSDDWSTIFFGNNYFYIGRSNVLYRSTDGISWELVNATNGVTPRGIVGSTLFGTSSDAFYRSDDGGSSWVELAALTYGFGNFVVEGGY